MQLTIHNLGKIRDADIMIDGITVIAAHNDTGKSTIGKAAFALLNSFEDFSDKIRSDMRNSLAMTIMRISSSKEHSIDLLAGLGIADALAQFSSRIHDESDLIRNISIIRDHYSEVLLQGKPADNDGVPSFLAENKEEAEGDAEDPETIQAVVDLASRLLSSAEDAQQCRQTLLRLMAIDVQTKSATLVERTFKQVFDGQVAGKFPDADGETSICLTTKQHAHDERDRKVTFQGEHCISVSDASDESRRVLIIDDPDVINSFDYRRSRRLLWGSSYRQELIDAARSALRKEAADKAQNLSESILAEEDMQDIIKLLQGDFSGQGKLGAHGMIMVRDQISEPINMSNASMGSKAMMLLRFLVEHLVVRNDDILVLDEPEIHLHPEWQITYAHALVLIAKRMGIKVIVTTHSPFFLKALAGYSGIEDYSDQVRYYTADDNEDGSNTFREVTDSGIGELYASMSRPLREIDRAVFAEMRPND